MPLNATNAERQATANRELAAKIRLEPPMARELRSMFAQISRDLEAFYALTGQVPDAQLYAAELTGILTRQYRRVDQEFSDNIIEFLRDADDDDPTVIILTAFAAENGMTFDELLTNMENDVTLREQNFIAANVRQDTINITSTTRKDLDASIIFGTLFLIDQGIMNPTRGQVAKQSRKEFGRMSRSRPDTIAATVTQKAAEGVKQIENDVFFGNRNRGAAVPLPKRELWITRGDQKVRPAHIAADNQEKNLNGVFIVGGDQLKFPGDTSLGASAGNVINCLHPSTMIDAANIKALTRRLYEGLMIRIEFSRNNELTVTPNHPILTSKGWILAKFLDEGDSILGCFDGNASVKSLDVQHMKSTIEEKFNSLFVSVMPISQMRADSSVVNFHGEHPDHDVDVIFPDSLLWNTGNVSILHAINEKLFAFTDFGKGEFFSDSLLNRTFFKKLFSFLSDGFVSSTNEMHSFFGGTISHSMIHSLRTVTRFNTASLKSFFNGTPAITSLFMNSFYRKAVYVMDFYFRKYFLEPIQISQIGSLGPGSDLAMFENGFLANPWGKVKMFGADCDRGSGRIETKNINRITHIQHSGYVYNLETESNIYLSEGVINHNCRCSAVLVIDDSKTPLPIRPKIAEQVA